VTLALSVEELSFEYASGVSVLRSLSFQVEAGECVALIGPNGAGKSTLLLHLNGILPERATARASGRVLVHGRVVNASEAAWVRRQVGVLFQDSDDQLFCPTVGEDVAYGPEQLGCPRSETEQRVARALRRVGLPGFEARVPQQLSGGEKRRVCLAGLLAYDPTILVLDEPSAGLDPRGRRELIEILAGLPMTRVIATHDLALVAELCARTLLLAGGALVASGPSKELLRDDVLMNDHGLGRPTRDLPAYLLEL
jgi:cobalt/nickel transport system ATP-binding protein